MKKLLFFLLLIIFLEINCLFAKDVETVAVVPFKLIGEFKEPEIYSHGMADAIAHGISNVPNIQVLERLKLGELLQEIKLQEVGLIADSNLNKIGKLLKAEIVITATVQKIGRVVQLHVRGIRVSTSAVVFSILRYRRLNCFNDILSLEHDIICEIIHHLNPNHIIEQQSVKIVDEKLVNDYINYCKGLYQFDKGNIEESRNFFIKSTAAEKKFQWIKNVRILADKIYSELDSH